MSKDSHDWPHWILFALTLFMHKLAHYRYEKINGVYSLKWPLTDRYLRWGHFQGRADADQCKSSDSAGTAHLGFPALLSVPHLLSREIKMNRRHCGGGGGGALRHPAHGIQNLMEAILPCHPALSTKWLDWVAKMVWKIPYTHWPHFLCWAWWQEVQSNVGCLLYAMQHLPTPVDLLTSRFFFLVFFIIAWSESCRVCVEAWNVKGMVCNDAKENEIHVLFGPVQASCNWTCCTRLHCHHTPNKAHTHTHTPNKAHTHTHTHTHTEHLAISERPLLVKWELHSVHSAWERLDSSSLNFWRQKRERGKKKIVEGQFCVDCLF